MVGLPIAALCLIWFSVGTMSAQTVLFSRRYRAALLDYLLGSGETGLSHAYDLGRTAIDEGLGLLQILRAIRGLSTRFWSPRITRTRALKG